MVECICRTFDGYCTKHSDGIELREPCVRMDGPCDDERLPEPPRRKMMPEYHIGCGAFGIYAGTLNSRNRALWQNKTDCTDEALGAVRDYMVQELLGGLECRKAKSSGYEWTLQDGRVVELRVTIREALKELPKEADHD